MKKFVGLIAILLTLGVISLKGQDTFSGVTINGVLTEGNTVYGYYNCNPDTLTNPTYSYEWRSYDPGGGGETVITDSIRNSIVLMSSLVGRRIAFFVTVSNGYIPATTVTESSSLSDIIAENQVAAAANPSIIELTDINVGSTLLGDYDYSDPENDPEGNSTYQWLKDETAGGTFSTVVGTQLAYTIQMADTGDYFKFRITPRAMIGNTSNGVAQTSAASRQVNRPPRVSVSIPGSVNTESVINATISYYDPDGDASDTEFIWLRDGNIIGGEVSSSYTTTTDDGGSAIRVVAIPKSLTGYPDTGEADTSNVCNVSSVGIPVASEVCIEGRRRAGQELTGKYKYEYNRSERTLQTEYWWLVDNIPVPGETSNKYTVQAGDVGKDIVFMVRPHASGGAVGDSVRSDNLAIFDMPTTYFSNQNDEAILSATPTGGTFSCDSGGIAQNIFDLDGRIPGVYEVDYYVNQIENRCWQKAYETLTITESVVTWNMEASYCWDEDWVTISVSNLSGGTPVGFSIFPSNKINAIRDLAPNDTQVEINVDTLGAGNKEYLIQFTYFVPLIGYITVENPIVIDSVGLNMNLIIDKDEFCENDDTIDIRISETYPSTGAFSWSSNEAIFTESNSEYARIDPGLLPGGGNVSIDYTYDKGSCSVTANKLITIHPKPRLSFSVEDTCVEFDNDSTRFDNTSIDSLLVEEDDWLWDFGESTPEISYDFEPSYLYRTEGIRHVRLTATTPELCTNTVSEDIRINIKPQGEFYWEDDCFGTSTDSLKIFDASVPNSGIIVRRWDIQHSGGDTLIFGKLNPSFYKSKAEKINVDYYLLTTDSLTCSDTVSKNIYIRPTYSLRDSIYHDDFETDALGWVADPTPGNRWKKVSPSLYFPNIQSDSLWYTENNPSGAIVNYAAESPCFDFRGVNRPMIKMDILRNFDDGLDGAVLQYKEGNDLVWENIGGTDFGIEWYDNSNITGRPGESVVGWSPILKDDTLVQARQYLDALIGKEDVKLRISYGSDGNALDSKGFAFDNIWIGERSRNVLVEHFTNYNSPDVVTADSKINSIIEDISDDAMNIQYHTNYRADDQLYLDNTAVPNSRMLYYSLVRNPYTLFDGGTTLNFAKRYDWSIADATINDLKNRSLTDPAFYLEIDTMPSYQFKVKIKPLKDIQASNMTLYLAVVAKEITSVGGVTNGQTEFRNVLRKMIPDAGGIAMKKDWEAIEDTIYTQAYSRSVSLIYDSDSVEVIAFLQNNITKEVYQAATSGSLATLSTSIGRVGFDEATFKIFPNPASANLTFLFDKEVYGSSEIKFYNNTGVVVREMILQPGIKYLTIDDLSLPNGIYIIKLIIDSKPQAYRKLIISNR